MITKLLAGVPRRASPVLEEVLLLEDCGPVPPRPTREGPLGLPSVLSWPRILVWWVFKVSLEMRGPGKGRLANGVWQTLDLSLQVGIPHHATQLRGGKHSCWPDRGLVCPGGRLTQDTRPVGLDPILPATLPWHARARPGVTATMSICLGSPQH